MILEICQHEKINLNVQHFKSQRNLPLDKLHPLLRKGKPDETQVTLESKVEDMREELSQKKTKAESSLDEVIDKAAKEAVIDKNAPSKATLNRDNLSR